MFKGKNSIGVDMDELMGLSHVLNKIFEAVERNEWRFLSKYGLLSLFFSEIAILSDIQQKWHKSFMHLVKAKRFSKGSFITRYEESQPAMFILIKGVAKRY